MQEFSKNSRYFKLVHFEPFENDRDTNPKMSVEFGQETRKDGPQLLRFGIATPETEETRILQKNLLAPTNSDYEQWYDGESTT